MIRPSVISYGNFDAGEVISDSDGPLRVEDKSKTLDMSGFDLVRVPIMIIDLSASRNGENVRLMLLPTQLQY